MIVLVCGGRDFTDYGMLDRALCKLRDSHDLAGIVHGGAHGADSLAGRWAEVHGVPVRVFPADWKTYAKAAGHIRNSLMLAEGKPDVVLAMPGGRGTEDMVRKARAANVPVIEVKPED